MSKLAYVPVENLPGRTVEEIQRLRIVEHRMAALVVDAGPPEGRILYATRKLSDLTGFEPEELIGASVTRLLGPETDDEALAEVRNAMAAQDPIEIDLMNETKSGVPVWVRLAMRPIIGPGGVTESFALYIDPSPKSRASYLSEAWSRIEREMN